MIGDICWLIGLGVLAVVAITVAGVVWRKWQKTFPPKPPIA